MGHLIFVLLVSCCKFYFHRSYYFLLAFICVDSIEKLLVLSSLCCMLDRCGDERLFRQYSSAGSAVHSVSFNSECNENIRKKDKYFFHCSPCSVDAFTSRIYKMDFRMYVMLLILHIFIHFSLFFLFTKMVDMPAVFLDFSHTKVSSHSSLFRFFYGLILRDGRTDVMRWSKAPFNVEGRGW